MVTKTGRPRQTRMVAFNICAGLIVSVILVGVIVLVIYQIATRSSSSNNLTNNPNPGDLKTTISKLPEIKEICVADENTDPNKMLGKTGGYDSVLYFKIDDVDVDIESSPSFGSVPSACELGTSGGGSIEVFKNATEAKKRNDYLSTFDGEWPLVVGTHTVLGTLVIRTSEKLTTSKQEDLENKLLTLLNH